MGRADYRKSRGKVPEIIAGTDLTLDLELVETRYWWQSVLYFAACIVLYIVLAASYAVKGSHTVWVFLINFAMCAVITVAKVLQRTSPETVLALEAVYLHGAIPAAMAVSPALLCTV